jgi:hypothetical protein
MKQTLNQTTSDYVSLEERKMPGLKRRSRQDLEGDSEMDEEVYDEAVFRTKYAVPPRLAQTTAAPGMVNVKKSELKSVLKSKMDIYNILTKEG